MAQAAEPVVCTGHIRDLSTGTFAVVQGDGVFDVHQRAEFGSGLRELTIAESDGYQVTLRRAATSGVLLTPELSLTLRHRSDLSKRLAVALGENHTLLIYENGEKYFQFNCYESARYKAHNDGLCSRPVSAAQGSAYRETCKSLCMNISRNFSSASVCTPYLQ